MVATDATGWPRSSANANTLMPHQAGDRARKALEEIRKSLEDGDVR